MKKQLITNIIGTLGGKNMKNKSLWVLISGLIMSFSVPVFAEVTPFRIALVDMNKAIQTVDQGKKAKADLQKEVAAKEKEVTNEEAAIRKSMEEFQKQASVMNEDARVKKQQEIQEKVMKHQEKRMRYQNEMQKREADLTKPIVERLRKLISDMSKQKGYQMVLEKNDSVVLFSYDSDDLTDELISQFNKSK